MLFGEIVAASVFVSVALRFREEVAFIFFRGEIFNVPYFSGLVLALVAGLLAVSVAHAQTLTTLVSFNGSNGEYPGGGLTLSADASTLYGTASQGGAYGDGTVFSVPVSGGSPTVLASLNVNASNGGYFPNGDLTLSATAAPFTVRPGMAERMAITARSSASP